MINSMLAIPGYIQYAPNTLTGKIRFYIDWDDLAPGHTYDVQGTTDGMKYYSLLKFTVATATGESFNNAFSYTVKDPAGPWPLLVDLGTDAPKP